MTCLWRPGHWATWLLQSEVDVALKQKRTVTSHNCILFWLVKLVIENHLNWDCLNGDLILDGIVTSWIRHELLNTQKSAFWVLTMLFVTSDMQTPGGFLAFCSWLLPGNTHQTTWRRTNKTANRQTKKQEEEPTKYDRNPLKTAASWQQRQNPILFKKKKNLLR